MGVRRRLIAVDGDGDEYYRIMEWNIWWHDISPSGDAIYHGTCLLQQWMTTLQTHKMVPKPIFDAKSNGEVGISR